MNRRVVFDSHPCQGMLAKIVDHVVDKRRLLGRRSAIFITLRQSLSRYGCGRLHFPAVVTVPEPLAKPETGVESFLRILATASIGG